MTARGAETSWPGAWTTTLHRTRTAVAKCGRVLLCDATGAGKTYIALATAAGYARVLLVTPAAVGHLWHEARAQLRVAADLISIESLSYPSGLADRYDLVVADVAPHGSPVSRNRYGTLARLCQDARVLVLSATSMTSMHSVRGAQMCGCRQRGSLYCMTCYITSLYNVRGIIRFTDHFTDHPPPS